MSDIAITVHTPGLAASVGREVVRAIRASGTLPPPTGARHRWEAEWEALTRVPWREWVRREKPKRVRVLLAERDDDTRVWIDEHEVHGLLRHVIVERFVGSRGDLSLVIPLSMVELL